MKIYINHKVCILAKKKIYLRGAKIKEYPLSLKGAITIEKKRLVLQMIIYYALII